MPGCPVGWAVVGGVPGILDLPASWWAWVILKTKILKKSIKNEKIRMYEEIKENQS